MPLNLSSKHTTDLLPLSGHICFPTCQASATALMGPVNVHANWPAFYYGIWVPGGGYVGLNLLSVISSTCLPSDIRKITLYDTDTVVVPSVAPKPVMRIACFVC